jgi:hypothetical protein
VIDVGRLDEVLAEDPEFILAIRSWSGRVGLAVGDGPVLVIELADGRVRSVGPADPREPVDIRVSGPERDWRELLAPVPRPFYQDLWGASFRHDLRLDGAEAVVAAYYPALRRLIDVLRETQTADYSQSPSR